jgi:hypothetical protein
VINGRLGNVNIAANANILPSKLDSTGLLNVNRARMDTLAVTLTTTGSAGSITAGSMTVQAASGGNASFYMKSDSAEDLNDSWRLRAVDGGKTAARHVCGRGV